MTLIPSHVFGTNPKIRNNIIYLDFQTVIYSAGPHIILCDELQKTQKFILINESGPITTMCAHSVSKILAIAIKGSDADDGGKQNGAYVVIYDLETLKKKKILNVTQEATEFRSVVFSKDAKSVFALAGDTACTIFAWNIEKGKMVASIKTATQLNPQINEISINPFARSTQICIIGNGILRVYKFEDPNFKVVHQVKTPKNMICHAWVTKNRMVAGTDDSKLLVFDSGEHILEIAYLVPNGSEDQKDNKDAKILSVESYSNGLIAGVSNGVAVFFEKTDDLYLYKKSREFLLEDSEVSTITINPTEKNALTCLNNGQIYTLPIEYDGKDDVIKADRYLNSFHHGTILGMDVASNKPLIITSGSDCSIRVWNYIENTLEVVKYFQEEAISVSIHPSGLYILAAFTNSIKLMTLLIDNILPFWDSKIPGCKECSFSNGGQFFAVVMGSTVQIYNAWSFRIAGTLKASKIKLKSIIWSKDDKKLISIDIEGTLIFWNVQTFKQEVAIADIAFDSAQFGDNSRTLLALAIDNTIKEIQIDGQIIDSLSPKGQIARFVASNTSPQLLGFTPRGTVCSIKSASTDLADLMAYTWHHGPIAQIRISPDDQYLFSAGEDGVLWIFKNSALVQKKSKEWLFTDEILVTKSDLKESYRIMNELRTKIEDKKALNDSQQRMKDIAYEKKTSDAIYRYNLEIKALKMAEEDFVKERKNKADIHKQKMHKAQEEHDHRMLELRTSFEEKMDTVKQKIEALKDLQRSLAESATIQSREIEQLHEFKVSELLEFCKKKLLEKDEQIAQIRHNIKVNEESFKSGLKDIDQDVDEEYIGIQHHFSVKLKEEQDIFLKIKDENQKLRADYEALARLIEKNKEEVVKMNLKEKSLRQVIKRLEVDIDGLKMEIQERQDTIVDKDSKIYDLRKKNQELEKFKFVLDYKVDELRKQIEPKEKDIIALTTQIEEISTEIKDYGAKELILQNSLDEYRMKDLAVATEKNAFIRKKETFQNLLKEIMRDVATVWNQKDELIAVKRLILSLFHKYSEINLDTSAIISSCGSHKINLGNNHKDPMLKQTLSRVALERTIKMIQSQKVKAQKSRFNEAVRFTSENGILKGELNYLTIALQKTKEKITQLNAVLHEHPSQNSANKSSPKKSNSTNKSSPKKLFSQNLSPTIFSNTEDPFPPAPQESLPKESIEMETNNELNLQIAD